MKLPWYVRCLKFIISALMWRDELECVYKLYGIGLQAREQCAFFFSVLLLERSLTWWDPALAETIAPSFLRFTWSTGS